MPLIILRWFKIYVFSSKIFYDMILCYIGKFTSIFLRFDYCFDVFYNKQSKLYGQSSGMNNLWCKMQYGQLKCVEKMRLMDFIQVIILFDLLQTILSQSIGSTFHTYITGHYNPLVRIIDLVSHTTYVVCDNFIHKYLDLHLGFERQVFF